MSVLRCLLWHLCDMYFVSLSFFFVGFMMTKPPSSIGILIMQVSFTPMVQLWRGQIFITHCASSASIRCMVSAGSRNLNLTGRKDPCYKIVVML